MSFCKFFSKCCSASASDDYIAPELNYEQVVENIFCSSNDNLYFSNIPPDETAIHLRLSKDDETNYNLNTGWKFHIGVHSSDIPRAWNIIKDILMEYRIFHAKCMLQDSANYEQTRMDGQGREITIYAFNEPDDRNNWFELVHAIEEALKSQNVRAVANSSACDPLPNCHYISYRCDQGEDGTQYLNHEDAIAEAKNNENQVYNPYNKPMPTFLTNLTQILSSEELTIR